MNKSFFTKVFSALLIVMLALGALPIIPAYAANTGLLSPTASVAGATWTNPNNAVSSNNLYATSGNGGQTVNYTTFGITIPAGQQIDGIEVLVEGTTTGRDITVELSWNNGANYTAPINLNFGGGADQTLTAGGAANTWGRAWNPATDFTNANFRVRITSTGGGNTFSMDHVQVRVTYTPDVAPTFTSIALQNPVTSPTNANTLVFRATFSEGVQNVSTGDFAVTGTTATVTNVAVVSASVYDVTVTGGNLAALNGTVGLNLAAGQNIQDLTGNALPNAEPATDQTYDVDNTTPSVVSLAIQNPATSPTNANSLVFRITFNENVTNIDVNDFDVAGTTANVTAVATVTANTVFDLTVSGGDLAGLNGTVTINLDVTGGGQQDITDTAGNAMPNPAPNPTAIYVVDNTAPTTATITQAAGQTDPTSTLPINFQVTFPQAINLSSFVAADITNGGTAAGVKTVTITEIAPNNGTTFNVAINGLTGSGTVTITIAAGTWQDAAGNNNTAASTNTDNSVQYNANTAPNAPSAINQYRTDATTVISQGGFTNQTQVVFKATATDPEANQYQLQVEAQPNASAFTNTATCTSPLTNSGTETNTGSCGTFVSGTSYKWQYRLLDSVGAATAWTSFGGSDPDFTVDATAPDTSITANPPLLTNSASASFSFTGSDPGGSGIASFQCQLDGGAFSACTSPQIYLGLSDGSHTFQVRAIDNAGNTDLTPAPYTWTVDTTAPAAPVVTTPANGSVTNDSTPSVSGTAEPNSTVTVYIDGSIAGTTTADGSGNWNFTAAALSDGSHTVRATSTDGVGNTSPDSNTNTFTVDTIAPAAPVVTTPVNGSTINDSTPSVSGTAEPNSTVTVYIDGSIAGTTTADGSGNWNFTTAALSDGSHTVRATATDAAGNISSDSNTNTFTVDTTAPDTTIDSNPTDPSNDTTPTFTFSSPDLTATFECSIDGGAFSACTSPNTLAALADGPHTFAVRAIDLLGNVDPSPASYTWTINTSSPIITNVTSTNADGTYFPGDVINIQVTFDEAVTVTGTPLLLLELGAVDGLANYVSGSGTNTLTFTYTVVPGDITPDLDYVDTASVTLNGGSIQDAALNNANLTLPTPGSAGSLGANKNIVIDTLILVVTNNGISSIPDTGDGSLSENEPVANTLNINQLVVNFNKDVYDVPASTTDPDEVDNPANYILVRSATGVFNTLSCAAGVVAPDIINPVTSVTYSNGGGSGPFVATLTLTTPLTTDGYYRLFVCGTTSIVQANNTALALAGNGIANGTDFIRNFQLITPAVGGGGGGGGAGARDDAKLAVAALPATGFAPGRITALPVQPDELAYSDLGDLWIEIPSLGIKTSIIGVPQTAEGEWDVTWLANNVGWLNGTAFPTWEGNSVVTAHVTNADGVDGPFANLKKLKYGDQIIIHLYGQKYVFEVRNSRLSKPFTTGFAFEDLEDASYLTLITCQTYLPKSDTYMHRRVIRAVLVSVQDE